MFHGHVIRRQTWGPTVNQVPNLPWDDLEDELAFLQAYGGPDNFIEVAIGDYAFLFEAGPGDHACTWQICHSPDAKSPRRSPEQQEALAQLEFARVYSENREEYVKHCPIQAVEDYAAVADNL